MQGALLTAEAPFSQFFTDIFTDEYILTERERHIMANAVKKRRLDFTTGRYCAKMALGAYGNTDVEILRAEDKQPVWPNGFTGSISHADGLCGAVVGSEDVFTAIGLDIEKVGGIRKEMWDLLYTQREQLLLETTFAQEQALFTTLLFSVKESFYKFQFPLTLQFLDFLDVEVAWSSNSFVLNVVKQDYGSMIDMAKLNLQWTVYQEYVITLFYLLK